MRIKYYKQLIKAFLSLRINVYTFRPTGDKDYPHFRFAYCLFQVFLGKNSRNYLSFPIPIYQSTINTDCKRNGDATLRRRR